MKEQIKALVRERMSSRRIILFGAGIVAEKFYEEYKDVLNISHCVSNIKKEWGKEMLLGELDVRKFDKKGIQSDDYIIVCGPVVFRTIEVQLNNEGFQMYQDFVESHIGSAIFQNKKIALFYGQCVLRDIYQCIIQVPAFIKDYVGIWTQTSTHQAVVGNRILYYTKELCDIYIYTPKILDRDSIYTISHEDLPKDCQIINVSNLVVSLYWPQIVAEINVHNEWYMHPYNAKRDLDFYHTLYRCKDCNINQLVSEGKTTDEIVKILSDDRFYSEKQVKRVKKISSKLISIAEKDVDVVIGDFIEDNYRKVKLYQNFVHSNKIIVWEYVRRLLKQIEISADEVTQLENESPEHIHQGGDVPIYPSVAKYLKLEFIDEKTTYEIMTGKEIVYMTFKEYIEHYAEYTRKAIEIARMW